MWIRIRTKEVRNGLQKFKYNKGFNLVNMFYLESCKLIQKSYTQGLRNYGFRYRQNYLSKEFDMYQFLVTHKNRVGDPDLQHWMSHFSTVPHLTVLPTFFKLH